MSKFAIVLTREAQNDIRRLARPVQERLLAKLEWIGENASLVVHHP